MAPSLLIIDDNNSILQSLSLLLKKDYPALLTATHPDKLPPQLDLNDIDLVLLDMNFKSGQTTGNEGIYWLKEILRKSPETIVIMMTAYGELSLAVECIKLGAFDFIQKPWTSEKMRTCLQAAWKFKQSNSKVKQLKAQSRSREEDLNQMTEPIIGQSSIMKKLKETIGKIAPTDAPILIHGENGTGKELVARAIHAQSSRKSSPFVEVDMGALNENLFESELFGHTQHAFTGAGAERIGRFEYANRGTLFLDEIGNLNKHLQAKLLRVLQNQSFQALGSNKTIHTDARLIFATNRDLQEDVQNGGFREDLYYRINTIELEVPPLRKRKSDITLLAQFFLQRFSSKYGREAIQLDESAIKALKTYTWPGNVRELQHVIERSVILVEGNTISEQNLLLRASVQSIPENHELSLDEVEKQTIQRALIKHPGNLTRVAKELQISRTTLYTKISKYGLQ